MRSIALARRAQRQMRLAASCSPAETRVPATSMRSTPTSSSSAFAIWSFSSGAYDTSGVCSPSRSVVSITWIRVGRAARMGFPRNGRGYPWGGWGSTGVRLRRVVERSWVVGEHEAGARLDVFLAGVLGASRGQVRALLAAGGVRIGRGAAGLAAKGRLLATGERVALSEPTLAAAAAPEPEPDATLVVLAEGDGWLAVDKPAGVPVHPLAPGERGTLLNALVARHPEVTGIG